MGVSVGCDDIGQIATTAEQLGEARSALGAQALVQRGAAEIEIDEQRFGTGPGQATRQLDRQDGLPFAPRRSETSTIRAFFELRLRKSRAAMPSTECSRQACSRRCRRDLTRLPTTISSGIWGIVPTTVNPSPPDTSLSELIRRARTSHQSNNPTEASIPKIPATIEFCAWYDLSGAWGGVAGWRTLIRA